MPYRLRQRLRRILAVYLVSGWATAWASMVAAGPDLLSLPWLQACVGVGVAWIGGFAASLNRMVTAAYDNRPFRVVHEFARDSAVSAVIGLAGYWIGMSHGSSPALVALVLILSGYAGTQALSVLVERIALRKGDS